LSATSLNFGTTTVAKQLSVTVTNVGTTGLTFSSPTISGTGAAEFAVVPYNGTVSTCLQSGLNLGQNQSCKITVQFNPPPGSGTTYSSTMSVIDSDPASPQSVKLSGTN
jgi:hypothetical protein